MIRPKHPKFTAEEEQHVKNAVVAMLLDPRNDGKDAVLLIEAKFGSAAFDAHFDKQTAHELLTELRSYAYDENQYGLLDFIGCVHEYDMMPCSSLRVRMEQAARRAL